MADCWLLCPADAAMAYRAMVSAPIPNLNATFLKVKLPNRRSLYRVEVVVLAAHVQNPVCNDRRGVYPILDVIRAFLFAGLQIEKPHMRVPVAHINHTTRNDG